MPRCFTLGYSSSRVGREQEATGAAGDPARARGSRHRCPRDEPQHSGPTRRWAHGPARATCAGGRQRAPTLAPSRAPAARPGREPVNLRTRAPRAASPAPRPGIPSRSPPLGSTGTAGGSSSDRSGFLAPLCTPWQVAEPCRGIGPSWRSLPGRRTSGLPMGPALAGRVLSVTAQQPPGERGQAPPRCE